VLASLLLSQLIPAAAEAQRPDTIVKFAGAPRYRELASVVEELSMGVVDGPPEYTFAAIKDIAIGQNGSMLILEGSIFASRSLRLYDAHGRFIRNVGRRGRGPGEWERPSAVAVMPDGKFLLLDPLNHRITVYSAAGDYTGTWGIPYFHVTIGGNGVMRVDANGIIAIRATVPPPSTIAAKAIVRVRPGGEVIDTLAEPALPDVRKRVTSTSWRGNARLTTVLSVPYSPRPFWQWSPLGYFVSGVTDRYAIDMRLPRRHPGDGDKPPTWREGEPVLSIRATYSPLEISPAERADQRASKERTLRNIGGEQSGPLPEIPRFKPFFRDVYVGDDGRIWIMVHTPSERYSPPEQRTRSGDVIRQIGWREPDTMDVFEPDGTYLGRVQLPNDLYLRAFRGDQIWGFVLGEFDVPIVKRYRVNWN
jgi:hypothetical protein